MPKTPEEYEAEIAALNTKLAGAQERITELNGESGGHRSAYKREKDAREAAEAARDEALSATDKLKKTHADELDRQRIDLTGRATAAENAATEARSKAAERARAADLRIAAKDAGLVDMDALKLLGADALKLDAEGNVTNAAEALAAMKTTKPYLFGQASTSGTATPPNPKPGEPKKASEMTPQERVAGARALGINVIRS